MATGDQNDMEARLQRVIPWSWFPLGLAPLYAGVVAGLAAVFASIYGLLAYIRNQMRLQTSTDGFLDLLAFDYFGNILPRRNAESDPTYGQRIKINLLRRRNSRPAVIKILVDLTGRAPIVFEPRRAADTGAYGAPNIGYGLAGGYGSRSLPCQAFITAFRPIGSGIPNVAGYGISVAGYSITSSQSEYASLSMIPQVVSDADIFAAINSVRPVCAKLWTRLSSTPLRTFVIATPTGAPIISPSGQDIALQ